MHGRSYLIHKS